MPINDYSEYAKFCQKAKQKLSYYDTVVLIVDGSVWSNKIYRNDLFQYCTTPPYGGAMHMCLKDVVYPIDWDKIGISAISLPVALRFHLTDGINVNPSREAILYSKETIALIKQRIEDTSNYFIDKYNDSIKEPKEFWEAYREIGSYDRYVVMPDKTFNVAGLDTVGKPINQISIKGMELRPSTWYKTNLGTLLGMFSLKAEFNHRGIWKTVRLYTSLDNQYANKRKVILYNGELRGNVKEYLKEVVGTSSIFVSQNSTPSLGWYKRNVVGLIPKEQWRKYIVEFQNVQKQIVKDFCTDYTGVENTQPYLDWLAERKEALKAGRIVSTGNYKVLNKQAGEVTIAYSRKALIGNTYTFDKNVYKLTDIPKTNSLVIVFKETEREQAREWAAIVKREKVAIIGEREFSKINHIKQFVTIKQFMEKDNKPFRRIATAILAKDILNKYNVILGRGNDIVKNCLQNIAEDLKLLEEYYNKNSNYYATNSLSAEILGVAKSYNLYDEEFMPVIKRMEKNIETFDFIQYIVAPRSWEVDKVKDVTKLINQMLLFRKKYHNQLENYELVYVAPPAIVIEPEGPEDVPEKEIDVEEEEDKKV